MPEPITTGAVVAATIATAASAIAKSALGSAGKDVYERLKGLLNFGSSDVERIEDRPDSSVRAAMLAELIDDQSDEKKHELLELSHKLRRALDEQGVGAAVEARTNVIATHGGIAAGRDINLSYPPPAPKRET
ncbi:hypothetical protein [Salipiger sp. PrR002]|uniref:hypothetical protein n=1 Tax=Salipiger sp. PrR002 TaxID=2706489 RepID=UPI0013BB5C0A|nr:hypothetical protein [Salipiger sp. PrR002]NDW02620.1 hypothetical protein [Salipiger sp. PrR002]NDW59856.1 hypothetical protein [Salipiger sp. PrR004]